MKKSFILIPAILIAICLSCCFCCAITLFLLSGSSSSNKLNETVVQKPKSNVNTKIAVINVSGAIMDGGGNFNSSAVTSPDSIVTELKAAQEDALVKAVIMVENTPGGTVIGAQKICDQLKITRNKIPVITYIESMGASGGYYIANCSDLIITNKEAITGSIGVILSEMDLSGLYDKVGIKQKVLTNTKGTLKSGKDFFETGSESEKIFKNMLDESFNEFVNVITEGRKNGDKKLSRDDILKLADGRVYSGRQAVENGLADKLGNFDDSVNEVQSKFNVPKGSSVIEYSNTNLLNGLFGNTLNGMFPGFQANILASELEKSVKPGVQLMYEYQP